MKGSRFKSQKSFRDRSAFQRLFAAAIPVEQKRASSPSPCASKMASIGCPSVQHSLVLSGLEEAVCAAAETTEVIHRVWGARTEVQKANLEASSASVRQVEHALLLAEALHQRSLSQLIQAEYAQLSRLRAEDVARLLD